MPSNDFVGVWATLEEPDRALRTLGVTPVWSDSRVAFGGAPVWKDPSSGLIVTGEYIPDGGLATVRRSLELPDDTPPLAVAATLFCRHGAAMGRYLPGMFALAFYEPIAGRLTLVRDPVGARTLYHTIGPGNTRWFAARLRPLRRAPGVSGALSLPALRDYLACAFVPGSQTLWDGISELRPGTALRLPEGVAETYWFPQEEATGEDLEPLEAHAARLRPLLEDAVRKRLPSAGTPVASYLSGGVDSSLVTAIAARAVGGFCILTFAIHFGAEYPNELHFSEMVAKHCGTRHTVVELPPRLIVKHLNETIRLLDDPIGDPLTVPNLILGRTAARVVGAGGTVLNGEGGDPVFGGPKNLPMMLHELYEGGTEAGRIDAYFRSYQKCYEDLQRLLTPAVHEALRTAPPQSALLTPFLGDDAPLRQYLNRLMQINIALKGADHILTKVSNLTSACNLVGCSPLFDPHIVDAGFSLPPSCKLSGAQEKAVLKAAVADLLPAPILTRPKSGMLVPVQRWFTGDLRRYAEGMLLSRHSRIRPYIQQNVVREWFERRGTSPFPRQGVKLWLLLTLEIWLRENE